MENLWTLLSLVMVGIGILGTFMPILPGLGLSFLGMLLYQFLAHGTIETSYLLVIGILTILSTLLNYFLPIKFAKKYGGSSYGNIGGFVGSILGIFFIPLPLGFLIGMLLGVFLGELMADKNNFPQAFSSTKGAFLGFIYGTGFSFLIGITNFVIIILDLYKT